MKVIIPFIGSWQICFRYTTQPNLVLGLEPPQVISIGHEASNTVCILQYKELIWSTGKSYRSFHVSTFILKSTYDDEFM